MALKFSKVIIITFVLIILSILASIWGVYNATECSLIKCAAPIGNGSNCQQPAFCSVYITSLITLYLLSFVGIIISLGYYTYIYRKIKSSKQN